MDIKHYEIKTHYEPEVSGWKVGWHGYYRSIVATEHEIKTTAKERVLEVDCLLSIVEDINNRGKEHIELIELGAGWGETCMSLSGIVRFKLIPNNINSCFCTAVEAEPSYIPLIEKHFEENGLVFDIIVAAISDEIGHCRFNRFTTPDSYFGQGITFGNFGGSKLKTMVLAAYHLLIGKTIIVPTITLDKIIDRHVDIIQCDVQGVENRAIKGAFNTMQQGNIDYWLIGTHSKGLNVECKQLLEPWYDCIVDKLPDKEKVDGLCQDGLQLFRRREL